MKKLCIFLACTLLLFSVGCGGETPSDKNSDSSIDSGIEIPDIPNSGEGGDEPFDTPIIGL